MSQSEFFAKPPRRGRIVVAVITGLVLVAAGITVGVIVTGDDSSQTETASPGSSASPSASTDGAESSLPIVAGEDTEAGVGVGYPHSKVGAVSAAVEFTSQVLSTLDPDRAVEVAEVANDPDNGFDPADAANTVTAMREQMGLPPTGDVPEGASIVTAPVAYQLRDETTDSMVVLLLCYVTKDTGSGEPQEDVGVFTMPMAWNGDDWKLVRSDDDTDYTDLNTTPGSDEARAKGWIGVTR
ncbi:hypothetical protein [Stackebrandtia nassauensis]|uniref:DUF8175 domain-containing protein n=1 Tax=Stackebrandtia nassauensis (strain DSM 44728 / CIP 108903 / NRRL B-16338 / NBRC 102104 / LLR-40K-21) TaxID=446470 RepID=D3PVU3_STANL|nr:hypothetical protein [Stackebrandtia nassauensis]ADD45064.1 hypothetical protein Snas_5432 [Stackebrandtia nassauensis DSM 44728]